MVQDNKTEIRAVIIYVDVNSNGLNLVYLTKGTNKGKKSAKTGNIQLLEGETFYFSAFELMVGDEIIIDENEKIVKLCPQPFCKRLKNQWHLLQRGVFA